MATNENKIITQGGCNEISPSIEVFSGSLTKCSTKSEINATKKKIVLEAGVNSNRKNLTSSYIDKQLVVYSDVGHYVDCTYNGAITDIPYIEFLYNNQIVESFYPFTEQGVTGGEKSFVLGLTYSFFEYDWSKMTIRASFGGKTNSLSSYKLNGYSGEKSSDGSYFVWNTTYANNILTGLINHTLEIVVDENKYGAELEITPSADSIYVGNTTDFEAFYYTTTNGVRDNNGVDVTTLAKWESSSETVATVSGGVVTGKNEGSVTISASYSGVSDNVVVGVSNYISITPTTLSFAAIGETKTVTVSATSTFSISEGLDWLTYNINGNIVTFTASENTSTVGRSGEVTFTCGSKTVTLNVSQDEATFSYGLEISPESNSISIGGIAEFIAYYAEYRNGDYKGKTDVTSYAKWESSSKTVATVSGGVVTGISEGDTTITALYGGESASASVSVSTYISINPTNLVFIAAGESKTVTVSAPGPFEISENLDWLTYSVNGNIVTFTASENKSTIGRSGIVTFTCGSEVVELSVSQNDADVYYRLYIEPSSGVVYVGETFDFIAYYYEYRNGKQYTYTDVTSAATWSSSTDTVAMVVSKGGVTGTGEGSATITVTYSNLSDSAEIEVYNYISINPTELSFAAIGETKTVTVYASSSFNVSESLSWLNYTINGNTVSFTASENKSTVGRSGVVTFTCGSEMVTLNVSQDEATVSYDLSIEPSSGMAFVGETIYFIAYYHEYRNGKQYTYTDVTSAATWTSSPETVAMIESKGEVICKGAGNATIFASCYGESADAPVIVYHSSPIFTVSPTKINLNKTGDTVSFTVSASNYGSISARKNGDWFTLSRTGDTGTYTVSAGENPYGGERTGSVTVTCVGLDGTVTEVTVNVTQYASDIDYYLLVSPSSNSVKVGDTVIFTATYYYEINGRLEKTDVTSAATWSSTTETVATVSDGVVTGVSEGNTTITASCYGESASATVSVYYPALSFSVSSTGIYLDETGDTDSFTVSASNYKSISVKQSGDWFTLSRTGDTGIYTVSAEENPYDSQRTGSITVTCVGLDGSEIEKVVTVTQYASEIDTYLIVSPSATSVNVGSTVSLSATYYYVLNGTATSEDVTTKEIWSSSSEGNATVSKGVVTGITGGTATVTATYNGSSDSCDITVNDVYTYSFYISTWTTPINVGDTRTYKGFLQTRKNGVLSISEIDTSWESTDTSVATISSGGIVTGLKSGTTTIIGTATLPNGNTATDSRDQIVTAPAITLTSLSVNSCYGASGTYSDVYVTATYSDGSTKNVTSDCTLTITNSSPNGVATISGDQVQHGAVGTATLNASYTENGITKTATANIETISVQAESMTASPGNIQIFAGETATITISGKLNNGQIFDGSACSFSIIGDTANSFSVTKSGSVFIVTGNHNGSGTIEFSFGSGGQTASVAVYVSEKESETVYSLVVSPETALISLGSTVSLSATFKATKDNTVSSTGVTASSNWESSNTNVATVSSSGVVTGKGVGSASITATYSYGNSPYTSNCNVTVNAETLYSVATIVQENIGNTSEIKLLVTMSDGSKIYPSFNWTVMGSGPGGPSSGTTGSSPLTFDVSNGTVTGGISVTTTDSYKGTDGSNAPITRNGAVTYPNNWDDQFG